MVKNILCTTLDCNQNEVTNVISGFPAGHELANTS